MKLNVLFLVTLGLAAGASVRAAPVSRTQTLTRNAGDQLDIRDHALLVVKRWDDEESTVSSQIQHESSIADDAASISAREKKARRNRRNRATKEAHRQALMETVKNNPTSEEGLAAADRLAYLQQLRTARNKRRNDRKKVIKKENAANLQAASDEPSPVPIELPK
jgi:hypothetical protein